jgi:beta-lactamase class A
MRSMLILSLMNKKNFSIIVLVLFALSLGANVFLFLKTKPINQISSATKYKLIDHQNTVLSIDADSQSGQVILHFQGLKEKIEQELSSLTGEEEVGFYLQNIKTGSWLGINEKEGFEPASLLKIPIAMAIFKNIENGKIALDQKITILQEDIDGSSGVPERFKIGEEKSITELLDLMLKISDNTAKNMLKRQLLPEDINSVFAHVGIENPYLAENNNQLVNPRQFSRFFKALYFSTYLSPEFSEKLLELLTETRAESLIAAGVPWEIQVAHKYGERANLLHDCGIVYYPENSYILCVMTKNIEITEAQNLIKQLSKEVFDFISGKD